jgi:Zn-dependent protease
MHLDLSPENMRWAVQAMGVLLLSICVHEFGHALLADKLGDDTPRRQGRLTLNPIAHADLIGTLIFPLIGLLYAGAPGFGWGKPVQTVPNRYSRKYEMRVGHMFVALAGPFMNLLFGTFLAILHVVLLTTDVLPGDLSRGGDKLFHYAVGLNYLLFFFNLIPAPPLDGGAVVEGLLPRKHLAAWAKVSVYGPFALMAFIMIPQMSRIFTVPADFVRVHVYDLLHLIFF